MALGPWIVKDAGVIAGVILKSTFLSVDDTGDPEVEGIRSDRGGVLGVHLAVNNPSFGGV